MGTRRQQRSYDHRLVQLVQEVRDPTIATRLGVPRSTVAGWLRRTPRPVAAVPREEETLAGLRHRVARLERRCRRFAAVLRILFVLLRTLKPDLSRVRIAEIDKARLLRAIARTRGVLGLHRVLAILGLSASRLHAWRTAAGPANSRTSPPAPGLRRSG